MQAMSDDNTIKQANKPSFVGPAWLHGLQRLHLNDLIFASHHATDFDGTRASQIHNRVQLLAFIYAILGLLWVGIDYATLPGEKLPALTAVRITTSAAFLALAFWNHHPRRLNYARGRLALLVTLPTLFFITSRLILDNTYSPAATMVYNFYPFVIVAQLAVFPLALIEGVLLVVPLVAGVVFIESFAGNIASLQVIGNFTLISLLLALALWAEMSQLQMLLRLYRQATRDPLTGLFNRRLLIERLDNEISRSQRHGNPLSLLLLDLDKFKRVNDTYGHIAGDMVLKTFSAIAEESIRNIDFIGRYGGEEFLVIMPETPIANACEAAERIRAACRQITVLTDDDQEISFSASIGVSQWREGDDNASLLERADIALYRAKEQGRDRVIAGE